MGEINDTEFKVLDVLDEALSPQLYPSRGDGSDPRLCPKCQSGKLHLKSSKTGGFVGCGNYPECNFTRPISGDNGDNADRTLGEDQGDIIQLKSGRFGRYIQRGEVTSENPKPQRASLPKGWEASEMDLLKALQLLGLPREIGKHPDDAEIVEAGIGRYGPFVKHGRLYANLKEVDEVFTIGMNRAVEVLALKASNGGRRSAVSKPIKELGEHPDEGGPVNVMDGKYGPYVKWGKINATLPKDIEPTRVDLETAVRLISEKSKKGPSKKKKQKR